MAGDNNPEADALHRNGADKNQNGAQAGGEANDEAAKIKKERDEYLAGWQRAKADFLNYKKDEVKRFHEIVKFSNEALVFDLVSVLDSFDLSIAALTSEAAQKNTKMEKGVYLIRSQLEDILRKYGLERLAVSIGAKFDPVLQESVASVESKEPPGTVVEEVERGYTLHGKVVRPARVKVSR